jgi:predicted MFS family arabinose efflux permease
MGLTFSIKQTGVPGGAALAGAALPLLALALGWRAALVAVAAIGIVITALAELTRGRLDRGHAGAAQAFSLSTLLAPLRTLVRDRVLMELSIIGFVYAAMQVCLTSFLVVYLTEALGFALVAAGLALTTANIGGIAGRIAWGAVADRWIAPRRMLGLIGIAGACCAYLAASFDGQWPRLALLAVCALFGATAIGWNGVQLSEVARQAPQGQTGTITGASGFISFAGVMLGPPSFALLAAASGSYRVGFAVFGSANLLCGLVLLSRSTARGTPPSH